MFGLFSKKEKKKEEDKALSNPEYIELVDKWEYFLSKIDARFQESLVNAEEALLENLEESNYDLSPAMRAWSGMKAQIGKLANKVEETFDENVAPKMLDFVEEWDLVEDRHKGTMLNEAMYLRMERFEIILEGKVAQKFYNHAIKEFNQDFKCTQCAGKLNVAADIFRAHYISCDYCNTVNTFQPSDKITQIRWVVENIAKYKAIEEWDAMKQAEETYHALPCKADHEDKSELLQAFEIRKQKEKAYWLKYFTLRSEYLTEYKDTIEHDVQVKMKFILEEEKNI